MTTRHETIRERTYLWTILGITGLALVVPFFFATFPPATDLPQHLGQVYLLGEKLHGRAPDLAVNWIAPGNLAYALLGLCSALFSAPLSGKIAMIVLVLMWSGTTFVIARNRERPMETAILLAPLCYSLGFYWGFMQFMIGWPVFALWLLQTTRPVTVRNWLASLVLMALLYASHALWFAVGVLWLVIHSFIDWQGWRSSIQRLSAALPVGILGLIWYPSLVAARKAAGFIVAPSWTTLLWTRLSPGHLVDSAFGGVKGALEPVMAVAILLWLLYAVYSNRGHVRSRIDYALLFSSLMFMAIVFFAPDRYMNTIKFASRWFPCALVLLALSLPAPPGGRRLAQVGAVCIVLLFAARTAAVWHEFNKVELSGLKASLQKLPRDQRVLGLSFPKHSDFIKGYPFLQIFAYAQAVKGGRLNFSFAEHSSGIISYDPPLSQKWTPALEWEPERLRPDDFAWFDYALINGNDGIHAQFVRSDMLEPVTDDGRWRLYHITH